MFFRFFLVLNRLEFVPGRTDIVPRYLMWGRIGTTGVIPPPWIFQIRIVKQKGTAMAGVKKRGSVEGGVERVKALHKLKKERSLHQVQTPFPMGKSNAYLIMPSRRIRASMVGSLPLKRL